MPFLASILHLPIFTFEGVYQQTPLAICPASFLDAQVFDSGGEGWLATETQTSDQFISLEVEQTLAAGTEDRTVEEVHFHLRQSFLQDQQQFEQQFNRLLLPMIRDQSEVVERVVV